MLEDDNTRLGRQTAGQSGALVADGMAVTLFIGGDAGVGGDVGMTEPGKTTSSGMGSGAGCMNAPKAREGQGGSASRRRESTTKAPIRPNGGAAGKHTWRGNALPPRRNRF